MNREYFQKVLHGRIINIICLNFQTKTVRRDPNPHMTGLEKKKKEVLEERKNSPKRKEGQSCTSGVSKQTQGFYNIHNKNWGQKH